jgi:hypothetical protein
MLGRGSFTAEDVTAKILPALLRRRCGKPAWTSDTNGRSIDFSAVVKSSPLTSDACFAGGPPVFQTRMSNPPYSATAVSTRCSAASGSSRSAGTLSAEITNRLIVEKLAPTRRHDDVGPFSGEALRNRQAHS